MVTLSQLNKISPAIVGVRGQLIADAINTVFPQYKNMTDAAVMQATIANLFHESAELTRFEENLNYSVNGLLKTFGRHRISTNQAMNYGRIDGVRKANKKAIANTIYGGNWGIFNLGNTLANDGWELRGSGALQGTGRKVLSLFTNHYNRLNKSTFNVYEIAEMLRDVANLKISMHLACWFVEDFKSIGYLAVTGRFSDFCRAINGGDKGLEERLKYYNRAKTVLV